MVSKAEVIEFIKKYNVIDPTSASRITTDVQFAVLKATLARVPEGNQELAEETVKQAVLFKNVPPSDNNGHITAERLAINEGCNAPQALKINTHKKLEIFKTLKTKGLTAEEAVNYTGKISMPSQEEALVILLKNLKTSDNEVIAEAVEQAIQFQVNMVDHTTGHESPQLGAFKLTHNVTESLKIVSQHQLSVLKSLIENEVILTDAVRAVQNITAKNQLDVYLIQLDRLPEINVTAVVQAAVKAGFFKAPSHDYATGHPTAEFLAIQAGEEVEQVMNIDISSHLSAFKAQMEGKVNMTGNTTIAHDEL
jgi:hypothetical protein